MNDDQADSTRPYSLLAPQAVLDAVDAVTPFSPSGTITPFASYVNRVYGVGIEEGADVVVKFYRPGRWSIAMIEDEHRFLGALQAADVPVVAPYRDEDGESLFELLLGDEPETILPFAIFPKRGGEPLMLSRMSSGFASVRSLGGCTPPERRSVMSRVRVWTVVGCGGTLRCLPPIG